VPQGSALAQLIRTRREEILAEWEAGIRTLASGAQTPQPALLDRVPAFLEWLAGRLDSGDGTADGDRDTFSHLHAAERLSRGFDLVEIVAEWALLRDILLQAWEASPEGVTPGEVRRLDAELDHVIALSVVEYARELRAAAPVPAPPPGGP
jgi:hypothetical protein